MTAKRRENLIYGFIVLGCAGFLLWIIPANTPAYPGYGIPASLTPNVAVGFILALSVLALLRNLLAHRREKKMNPKAVHANQSADKTHLGNLAAFMIPCILLMPAMQWVGFIPGGLGFMLLIQYLCGQRRILPAVCVAVGTVGVLYVAMNYGLGVPMP